jgi:hypothetical protein
MSKVDETTSVRLEELADFCQSFPVRSKVIDDIYQTNAFRMAEQAAWRRVRGLSAPELEVPSVEMTSERLYALGIKNDAIDDAMTQSELDENQRLTEKLHAKRLEDLKAQQNAEKQSVNWSIAVQVFSWIASFLGIFTGIALIATGVGAVAGAFLLAGGLINLTSQILDITGGWDKITNLFPGDDVPEKKKAVRTWIQIAITVLSAILGGIGGVMSGFKNLGAAMKFAGELAPLGLLVGHSAVLIGKGVTDCHLKKQQARVCEDDISLTELEASREDETEKLERRYAGYEQNTELLSKLFSLRMESFKVTMKTIK